MSSIPPPSEFSWLGPVRAPRIWTGLWQLSSSAWGSADVEDIKSNLRRLVDNKYYFFDMPTTTVLLRTSLVNFVMKSQIRVKCSSQQNEAVKARLRDLQTTRIDLLQFHWQDYNDKGYLDALHHLQAFQEAGYISNIGLCNFDTKRTDEICTILGPGAIVSNQVGFSLIDTRPLHGMGDVCAKHGVKLLTYGTLCGNFLTDKWLGKPLPDPYGEGNALTPSQRKARNPHSDAQLPAVLNSVWSVSRCDLDIMGYMGALPVLVESLAYNWRPARGKEHSQHRDALGA
ncbi:hypothetical protein NP233_g682 [Leucocoprinus birnbaumii]|uniref:NADP-dependent oxidoreductase domain-containing protein n=1 Tax=Leucocoprinus birnbaumii TaxID=56174 RepID=A0AAD5W1Q8_9AGAR|nr:hypothetical protein NP233_g682 [Leucocoprinus birnbaumii]